MRERATVGPGKNGIRIMMIHIAIVIAIAVVALGVGGLVAYGFLNKAFARRLAQQERELSTAMELEKKDQLLKAEERFFQLKRDFEDRQAARTAKLTAQEQEYRKRDASLREQQGLVNKERRSLETLQRGLEQQQLEVERSRQEIAQLEKELEGRINDNDRIRESLRNQEQEQQAKLEEISGLTSEQAKEQLMQKVKEEARQKALAEVADFLEETQLNAHTEAQKIIIKSIQRLATETAIENAVTVFHIEDDAIKGKIIGREGRNIQSFESATGVELIVDDTPDAIVISAFDPVRREVARLALHQLVQDGRIHPARIEEVVKRVQRDIENEIVETGKRTALDLNIQNLHPELIRMVGRMKYRSSYGQNLLQHSREVANLCAIMASELGLNVKLAKRAGLLHDIGKVSEDEPELPHALLGMQLAERHNEKPDVVNAIGAHHNEVDMTSFIAPIVQICDAISGARPGARREVIETYIKRLQNMERLARSYKGVEKSYAIQAGRELRVIVGCEKVSDHDAQLLALDIAQKIENELTYPGQVKVTVIREMRAVGVAK